MYFFISTLLKFENPYFQPKALRWLDLKLIYWFTATYLFLMRMLGRTNDGKQRWDEVPD
jgi:hypothetical protein